MAKPGGSSCDSNVSTKPTSDTPYPPTMAFMRHLCRFAPLLIIVKILLEFPRLCVQGPKIVPHAPESVRAKDANSQKLTYVGISFGNGKTNNSLRMCAGSYISTI
eukprot:1214967-Amphidinium_carterae.1